MPSLLSETTPPFTTLNANILEVTMHYFTFPSWLHPQIIPGLPFRWYALMYIVAFFITWRLFLLQADRDRIPVAKDSAIGFFIAGFVGGLLGGRIFYCLVYDASGHYLAHPWLIFWPFDQSWRFVGISGMSHHGGIIGGITGTLAYGIRKKIDLLQWGDMVLAGLPLGYMFGRLGNFINGELYGRVSTAWWSVLFPNAEKLPAHEPWVQEVMRSYGIGGAGSLVNLPRHPSQIYEALGEGLLLWFVLWFVVRRRKPFKGAVVSAYIVGYGAIRFIIEYFRTPDADMGFPIMLSPVSTTSHLAISPVNFTTGQILCAVMIASGIASWFIFRRMHRREEVRGHATVP